MRYKKALAITLCLLTMALFVGLRVKMNFGVKPNVRVIPRLSAMILYKGWSDEEIVRAIENDSGLLDEHFYSSLVVAQRTPLLSALEKNRKGLVVYLLSQGAPVRDSVEILHREGLLRHIVTLREVIDREGLGALVDCDALCLDRLPGL